jgi:hypothetical protein
MRVTPFLAAGTAIVALSGCNRSDSADTGPKVDRAFTVAGFTGIEVAGPYDVIVRTGPVASVHATGSEKALDRLHVEVEHGTLEIGMTKRHGWNWGWDWNSHKAGPVTFVVTVPGLDHAAIAGSGGISIDKLSGSRFKGEVAGSGDLKLASVDVADVSFEIAGSGSVVATGKARTVNYEIAGSGGIDAAALTAEIAKLSIAGSGDIKGHATGTADIEILGSGDVTLTGGAKCTIEKHGSGDVTCS